MPVASAPPAGLRPAPTPGRLVTLCLATLVGAVALAGCGGTHHSSAPPLSASALLTRARTVLDATPAVHFALTSSGVSKSKTQLVSGTGDLARPDELRGTFTVSESGLDASVKVISTKGTFYVDLPFAPNYTKANPAAYGLGNPAELLSTTKGVSALLSDAARNAHRDSSRRVDGELLDVVSGTVPGADVPVLPDADRAKPVALTASIDPTDDQLREVTLAGPFTSVDGTTTYTVTLTDYGEHVTIAAPA